MKKYTVRPYQTQDFDLWNAFLTQAKNATFLFHRDFMEYHSDRFQDFSLLVFEEKKLVALLPANKKEDVVFSHQGLTYGGLVFAGTTKLDSVIMMFKAVLEFLSDLQIRNLHLKLLPSIYYEKPSQELDYALFLADAKLIRRDTLAVIDLSKQTKRSQIRERGVKKGKNAKLEIREEESLINFWNQILIPNLDSKHQVKPVHTLAEIAILKSKFHNNIRQFNVYLDNDIVGGATIFETQNVAHVQYISANEAKSKLGTLDYLIEFLTDEIFVGKPFFDFGISNEEQGRKLNAGLSYWKESFGAHTICQDFYDVETKNHVKLENVFR